MSSVITLINHGTQPGDGLGEVLFYAWQKANANFQNLCNLAEAGTNQTVSTLDGTSLFSAKSGTTLQFKGLDGGTGIEVVDYGTVLEISNNAEDSGENNTASNLGGGVGLFEGKSGVDLRFKSLVAAGSDLVVYANGTQAVIENTGTSASALTTSSAGGASLVLPKSGQTFPFKGLSEGTNIEIIDYGTVLQIGAASVGQANTASNVGGGEGLFQSKSGVDLQFKSLVAGPNMIVYSNGTQVVVEGDLSDAPGEVVAAGQNVSVSKSNGTSTVAVTTVETTTVDWQGPLAGDTGLLGYSGTVAVDFDGATPAYQTVELSGDVHLAPQNMAPGRSVVYRLNSASVDRNLTVQTEVAMLGTFAGLVLADKTAVASFTSFGSTVADIVGAYNYQF